MKKVIASAASREALTKIINDFYFSKNIVITPEFYVYNKKLERIIKGVKVSYTGKRWRFKNE